MLTEHRPKCGAFVKKSRVWKYLAFLLHCYQMEYIEKFPPATVAEENVKLKLNKYLTENKDPFSKYIFERDKQQRKLAYLSVATLIVFSLPILLAFLFNNQNLIWLIFIASLPIVLLNDVYTKYITAKNDLVFEINYVCFRHLCTVYCTHTRKW